MAIALMPSSVISTVPTTSKSTANVLIAPKKMTKSDTEVTSSSGASPPKGLTGGLGSKAHHGAAVYHHPTLGYAIPPPQPAKVARRNARERNRVKQVNCGFELLRSHIPSAAKHKKMSKVDTLRHAVEYIENLQMMLDGDFDEVKPTPLQTQIENQTTQGIKQEMMEVKQEATTPVAAAPVTTPATKAKKGPKPKVTSVSLTGQKPKRGRKPKVKEEPAIQQPPPLTYQGPTSMASPASNPTSVATTTNMSAYTQRQTNTMAFNTMAGNHGPLTPRTPNSPDFSTTESGYDTASYASYGNPYFHGNPSPMHTPGNDSQSSCPPSPMPHLMAPPTTTGASTTCYPNQHLLVSPQQQSPMMFGNPRANSVSPVTNHQHSYQNHCDSSYQQQQSCFQQSSTYVKYPQPTPYGNPGMYGNLSNQGMSSSNQHQMMHSDEDEEDILDAIVKWQES